MPQRASVRTIPSPDVQGDDSWVKLSAIKLGDYLQMHGQLEAAGKAPTAIEQARLGINLLSEHIVGWNWVDDYGEPLALPKDDPSVIEGLTEGEAFWLIAQFTGPSQVELKNSVAGSPARSSPAAASRRSSG